MLALKEQEEALIVLEALEADAIKVQARKTGFPVFWWSDNPLYKVIERINKQMLIGKPKTLADLFSLLNRNV